MTSNPNDIEARWQRLAKEIRARNRDSSSLDSFLDRVAGVPDPNLSHEECQALLPAFVTLELNGLDPAAQYPQVQYHLDRCPTCEQEYAELLTLEIALAPLEREGLNGLTLPESLANPTHYRLVKQISERALERLDPGMAPLSLLFIDPLLETLIGGETIQIPLVSDEQGGMGIVELFPLVVVPVVAVVMKFITMNQLTAQEPTVRNATIHKMVNEELRQLLAPQSEKSVIKAKFNEIAQTISTIIVEWLNSE